MNMWKESQLRQIFETKEIKPAYEISLMLAQRLGFNFCAFSITSPAFMPHHDNVSFNNYPVDWNSTYEHDHFGDIDPILAHCNQSEMPILWEDKVFSKAPQLRQAQKNKACSLVGHNRFMTAVVCAACLAWPEATTRSLPMNGMDIWATPF
jgi:LuxR family transcriptional regulator